MSDLTPLADRYLSKLCFEIDNRCVGSRGNQLATTFFREELERSGWTIEQQAFEAFDWTHSGASLSIGARTFQVFPSPYSLDCKATAPTIAVTNLEELAGIDATGNILIVREELAREQLMPKNFVFYNPGSHQKIVALLEKSGALALVFIVSEEGRHEGGEYPFPIVEDGDFTLPSVFMSCEEGEKLLPHVGAEAELVIQTTRTPSTGYNVIGRKGAPAAKPITITAHIDAKKGTPGAIDNATGVVCLLLLARLLAGYEGAPLIELVAFNGEDYYSVPGQMTYIKQSGDRIRDTFLNINIDGAGLKNGNTAFSFFNLQPKVQQTARDTIGQFDGIVEGKPWVQGDHSIFLQYGVPAIAISSEWLIDHLASQDITHTPKDNVGIVDGGKLVELATALCVLIKKNSS